MSSWNHSVLVLMMMLFNTVVSHDCPLKLRYSDSRMNQPYKSPLWKVLDMKAGLVQFYFNESHQTNEVSRDDRSWALDLYQLIEVDPEAVVNATFQNCTMSDLDYMVTKQVNCELITVNSKLRQNHPIRLHSRRRFLQKNMTSQEVKWQFKYVFSGWYVLSHKGNNRENIVSAPLLLKTNYTKQDLGKQLQSPGIQNHDFNTVAVTILGDALDNDCGNPMHDLSCVLIELENRQTFYIYRNTRMEGSGLMVCSENANGISLVDVRWSPMDVLSFKLNYLTPKINTTIKVKIFDTRCSLGVWNWDRKQETCIWISEKFNVTALDHNRTQPEPPSSPGSSGSLVLGLVVGIIGVAAVIIVAFLRLQRTHSVHPKPHTDEEALPLNKSYPQLPTSGIFLLYARDCDIFMGVMETFRHLLEQSTLVPVYDIWDEKNRNELDILGNISFMKYLESENTEVKVIIVATPVSRTIETLIIHKQWPSSGSLYSEPHSLDEVFFSAFKTCIQLTNNHPERCMKFIVTRLQTIGCVENHFISFNSSLGTIYTLPSRLRPLFAHILNYLHVDLPASSRSQCDHQSSVLEFFETKIKELDNFIKLNPAYEERLLSTVPRKRTEGVCV